MASSKIYSNKYIKTKELSASGDVDGNSNKSFPFSNTAITGYTMIGLIEVKNSHGANFPITDFRKEHVVVRNLTATTTTVTITATGLYVRNDAFE